MTGVTKERGTEVSDGRAGYDMNEGQHSPHLRGTLGRIPPLTPFTPSLVTRTLRLSSLYVHPFALRSVSLGTPLRGRNGR